MFLKIEWGWYFSFIVHLITIEGSFEVLVVDYITVFRVKKVAFAVDKSSLLIFILSGFQDWKALFIEIKISEDVTNIELTVV